MTLRKAVLVLPLLALFGCMDREIATAPDGPLADITPQSVTITVENLDDSGPGSLRQAIFDAGNGHVIIFDPGLAPGTLVLSSELEINKSLTIVGPEGGITISGNDATRIFRVFNVFEVVLENLILRNGSAHGGSSFGPVGGAILNHGNLTVKNSSIESSWAQNNGGAIENVLGSVTILNSTVSYNGVNPVDLGITVLGGGINNFRGTVTVINSTISGNSASSAGGGIMNYEGTLAVTHGTIANNGASGGGGIFNRGNAFDQRTAVTTLVNAIVAGNVSGSASNGPDIHNLSAGALEPDDFVALTASRSLIGATTGHSLSSAGNNLIGVDPRFELDGFGKPRLSDNGGPTKTHALLENSPAIDAASSTACTSEPVDSRDQRGIARPQGAGCDMGAFELVGAAPPPPPPSLSVSDLSINASGTVNKTTGTAVISGTLTCSTPGVVDLKVDLSQEQKQKRLTHTVVGSTTVSVSCTGSAAWATAVTGSNGVFVNGAAHAAVETLNAAETVSVPQDVKLFWSK